MAGGFLKRFSGVTDNLPDEITILNFRHLLEQYELTAVLLEAINAHLKSEGLLVSKGTMIDATLTHMPSSTKNREQARDTEMRPDEEGKAMILWHKGACWCRRGFNRGTYSRNYRCQ